jgi:2-oxoglutarate ferredoxin oxidoreductase subunit gamma
MTHELLFAGFGGQGVLSMGMTLAYAGMIEGKEVSWMPSYGPEMRGGTANCIAIVSERAISSPIVSTFDAVSVLNQPSLDRFEKSVRPGGLLLYDSAAIIVPPRRTDLRAIPVPASDVAVELKNTKVMNMVMLGALLELTHVVEQVSMLRALAEVLPERYHHLLPLNEEALKRGAELAAQWEPTGSEVISL